MSKLDKITQEKEEILKRDIFKKETPFRERLNEILRSAPTIGWSGRGRYSDKRSLIVTDLNFEIICVGGMMEDNAQLVKATTEEMKLAKEELQRLCNEVRSVSDFVVPELVNLVKKLRDSRMSAVSEISASLSAMRDVRRFFLEDAYTSEMERLERFVALCKELKALKSDGTIDSVIDASLKLAVK